MSHGLEFFTVFLNHLMDPEAFFLLTDTDSCLCMFKAMSFFFPESLHLVNFSDSFWLLFNGSS